MATNKCNNNDQRAGKMVALHLQVGLLDIGDASTVQPLQRQLWDRRHTVGE